MVKNSTSDQTIVDKKNEIKKYNKSIKKKFNDQQMIKKQLDFKLIMPFVPKDKDSYYIIGDICIDFDLIRNQKSNVIISSLSEWRRILQIEKYQNRLHITLEKPRQQAIQNFDFIIQKLNSLGDQRYKQFAIVMECYKEKQKDFLNLKSQQKPSQVIDFSVQYWLSKIKALSFLYNVQQSPIKYYAYHICAGSYEGQIIMEKGFSDDLIKILGLDFESFKTISLRRGIIDFLCPETQLNIVLRRMLLKNNQNEIYSREKSFKTTLITADSYTINVISRRQLIILNDINVHDEGHLNDTLGFVEIEIEESVIKELEQRRKVQGQLMFDSDYDFEYNMQAEVFIKSMNTVSKPIETIDQNLNNNALNLKQQLKVAKYRDIIDKNIINDIQIEISQNSSLDINQNESSMKDSENTLSI